MGSDSLLGVLACRRDPESPLAGKSTLNRLESPVRTPRYHKIGYSAEAFDSLLVDIYLEAYTAPTQRTVLDVDLFSCRTSCLSGRQDRSTARLNR